MNLTEKRCKPCEDKTPPLTPEETARHMIELPEGWHVVGGTKIQKEFLFADFIKAMAFVDAIADIAELEGHHPDIHIHYNKVLIELWTHAIGGLSENDFIVASKIEEMLTMLR